jgi:hypothetical protein
VIASRIGPSFADQTEHFKRFLVVLNIIDDGRDKFLREIFASRHGHRWTPLAITDQNTVNKTFNMSAELARNKKKNTVGAVRDGSRGTGYGQQHQQ